MMENRITINHPDLDGFDKRKIPSPGFQVEIVMVDYDGSVPPPKKQESGATQSDERERKTSVSENENKASKKKDEDDIFTDSEGEENETPKTKQARANKDNQIKSLTQETQQMTLGKEPIRERDPHETKTELEERESGRVNDIKAIAADASVFSFGDDEDFESD